MSVFDIKPTLVRERFEHVEQQWAASWIKGIPMIFCCRDSALPYGLVVNTMAAAEHERWAAALAIDEQHGPMAPAIIKERVRTLALAGDEAGVALWRDIAVRYDQLRAGTVQ